MRRWIEQKIVIDVKECNKGDRVLRQFSPLPQSSVMILIKKAKSGGFEKYPQSKFWAQSQYWASSKWRGSFKFIFSNTLTKKIAKEKHKKYFT